MRQFRNRPLQSLGLLLLSSILTAIVGFAPLYDAAMQREATAQQLSQAPGFVTDLRLSSTARFDLYEPLPALSPGDLARLVPSKVRVHYDAPVTGHSADATLPFEHKSSGKVIAQPDQCELISITEGACPTQPGEVLVSGADHDTFGYRVGEQVQVFGEDAVEEQPNGSRRPVMQFVSLTVVGWYDASPWQEPTSTWAGQRLGGLSGTLNPGPPEGLFHDAWITAPRTFTSEKTPLPTLTSYAALALDRDAVGADEVALVAEAVERLRVEAAGRTDADVTLDSTIGSIAENVAAQAAQARVTVPLLMAQLALLCLVALWLALGAAAEDRRPEVALVRLRGRGRRGARRFMTKELLPIVLAGVLPGAVLATLGCALLQRVLLSADDRFPDLDLRFAAALGIAALTLSSAVALIGHRISLQPVADVLRRVPVRRSSWRVGVLAAVTVAASVSALVAIITGGATGPVALAVPALLALTAGVLLAHVTGPVTALLGRALLRRGRLVGSIALLDSARRGSAARTVAMVTVAAGLVVFSANALAVGDRNWSRAAAHTAGAAVVVEAEGQTVGQLRAAAAEADPSGDHVSPVARIESPGVGSPRISAVMPRSFAQVALFPDGPFSDAAWSSLELGDAEPLVVTGRRASLRIRVADLVGQQPDGEPTLVALSLMLQRGSVGGSEIRLSDDLVARSTSRARVALPCAQGCTITGLRLRTVPGSRMSGTFSIDGLRVDGVGVSLHPEGGWQQTKAADTTMTPTRDGQALRIAVDTGSAPTADVLTAWMPDSVPVLATEALVAEGGDSVDGVAGLDGLRVAATLAGTVGHVPASGDLTLVANLEALERLGPGPSEATTELWLDSPSRLDTARRALTDRGFEIREVRRVSTVDAELRSTTAAWSLQLSLVVGALGLLLAAMVLVVVAIAGWRSGSRDLAALRLGGVPANRVRRLAVIAQLPAVVTGIVVGTMAGVAGARIAMPIVPLFTTDPEVSLLDLDVDWWVVVAAASIALAVLAGTAALSGIGLARRARIDRIRETL